MPVRTVDEVYVEAEPADVYRTLIAFGKDFGWWPGARATSDGKRLAVSLPAGRGRRVRFDAGVDGVRPDEGLVWVFEGGDLSGHGEWWLEPFKDGTIVHYYLEAERAGGGTSRIASRIKRHRWAIRRGLNALKDLMEGR